MALVLKFGEWMDSKDDYLGKIGGCDLES